MDSLTHLIITRKLFGTDRDVLIAGVAPDLEYIPRWMDYPFQTNIQSGGILHP